MKKTELNGREILSGIHTNKISVIRDELIYGSGKTLKEKKKKEKEDLDKRLDETKTE